MEKQQKGMFSDEYIDYCTKERDIRVNGRCEKVMVECGVYPETASLSLKMHYAPTAKEWQDCPPPGDQILKPLGMATVSLPESSLLLPEVQFVDSRSFPEIGTFLEKEALAAPTGLTVESGGHRYRAYRFLLPDMALAAVAESRRRLAQKKENERRQRLKVRVTFKR